MSEPIAPPLIHLPRGLDRALLRILSYHVGREHAISHLELCNALRIYQIDQRQLHAQISQLRRSGHLIGSASGEHGGYYLIATPEEFQEFISSAFQARIDDLRQTVTAMTKSAVQRWGPDSIQFKLF